MTTRKNFTTGKNFRNLLANCPAVSKKSCTSGGFAAVWSSSTLTGMDRLEYFGNSHEKHVEEHKKMRYTLITLRNHKCNTKNKRKVIIAPRKE